MKENEGVFILPHFFYRFLCTINLCAKSMLILFEKLGT